MHARVCFGVLTVLYVFNMDRYSVRTLEWRCAHEHACVCVCACICVYDVCAYMCVYLMHMNATVKKVHGVAALGRCESRGQLHT